jgi:hypothetical protein
METLEMGYLSGAAVAGFIGHGLIGNSLSGYQLHQENKHHDEGIALDKHQHKVEMDKSQRFHEAEIAESRRLCIAERNTELKQHFQALNADLINSNREAERDMYEQRNSQFQTIIVASTVMFGALCTVIIEGNLPLDSGKWETIILMAISGMSFALLFVCMVLSLKLILRSSRFMYTRASVHNRVVNKLARDTVRMLEKMDTDMKDYDRLPPDIMWNDHVKRVDEYLTWRQEINDLLFGNLKSGQRLTAISPGLTAENFDRLPQRGTNRPSSSRKRSSSGSSRYAANWQSAAEDYIVGGVNLDDLPSSPPRQGLDNYSQDTSFRSLQYAEAKASLGSFETFWRRHCALYAYFALRLFYGGMVFLLMSLGMLMFMKLKIDYHNPIAAFTFASFLFISVVGTVVVISRITNRVPGEELAHDLQYSDEVYIAEQDEIDRLSDCEGGVSPTVSRVMLTTQRSLTNLFTDDM